MKATMLSVASLVPTCIKNVLIAFTVVMAILVPKSSYGATLSFDFSFTNTLGVTSGTVTGQIYGLSDNATSAARSIFFRIH